MTMVQGRRCCKRPLCGVSLMLCCALMMGLSSVLMMKKKKNHRVPRSDEERNKEESHLLLHANENEPYRFPLLIMKDRVDSA